MTTARDTMTADQVLWVVPPSVVGMLCGVKYARQDKAGVIEVTYTNGTTAQRACEHDITDTAVFPSFFALVAFVQAGAV